MSLYLLPVLILLLALAWLTGAAWERRHSRAREADRAWRDACTGLYGRAVMLELLGRQLALAARLQHSVSLLLVELDQPDCPDPGAWRQALAQRLAGRVRGYDLLGHWGEFNFLIALSDSDVGSALVLAQDLRDGLVQRGFEIGGQQQAASVSVSVHSRHPVRQQNSDELAREMVAAAQRALHATRADGPGRVVVEP